MKSGNGKVGPIPVSTTTEESCPQACPLLGKCYAAAGPLKLVWQQTTNGTHGTAWDGFVAQIALLPDGQAWRHNQAGDLPGIRNEIDAPKVAQLAIANVGKRGFTYTHKPMIGDAYAANRAAVAHANSLGFTVNLSANTLSEADTLSDLAIGPVVVLLDSPDGIRADTVTPAGRKVATCPATYRDDISCGGGTVKIKSKVNGKPVTTSKETSACMLCQRQNRKVIVGFPVHGTFKQVAGRIARGESN